MSVTVKICGITSEADALAAVEAGADAIGLMFYEGSPRHVTLEQAKAISAALPQHVMRVGVFVNAEEAFVHQALTECMLNILQFHGDETPEECSRYPVMTLKAFRVQGDETLAQLEAYPSAGYLLDAYVKDALGGTGATFNWDLAVRAQEFGKPIFLAGGLTPENVVEAVRKVQPFGVDVSSGVESEPGRKDAEQMRTFVSAAKGALA
ncbi:MAG TPA: phosphoribosylanthranilate isomerase [Verrucomicrobiales bacterium]|nr:phosphoribosylanthranilate isomerase [Verrucomicrobiales bacterium]